MKKLYSLLILSLACCCSSFAQTVSVSLVTAPCANNGVLQATSTGFTGTVTYAFYIGNGAPVVNTTGTLTGYSGAPVYTIYAYTATQNAYTSYAGAPPFTYTSTTTSAVCPALGTASVAITGGTSPYTVLWRPSGSTTTVATGASVSLPDGAYDVFITDAAGCTYGSYAKQDSIYVHVSSPVTFTVSSFAAACTNGSASVVGITGGTSPYTYLWSNAATSSSISGLVRGYYNVKVTDASGCAATNYVYVAQTPVINVNTTVTNATCLLTNGSATSFGSGGTGPYTYLWSNTQTTQLATGLSGGLGYTVTATDVNGCTGTGYAYINSTTPITATSSATASSCTAATGTATVTASGGTTPYSIVWNTFPTQTGTTATGLPPGSYGFTITDATGCRRTGAVYVPPVSVISASVGVTNATCTASNGSATVTVSSGASPYTYSWSNSATTATTSGLTAGSYSVTITDNLGCRVTKYATININSPVSIGFSATPATCIFNNNGSITATATGGTAPYTYNWGSVTGATHTSLSTGSYYVTATDAVGCTATSYAYVGYNASNSSCYCTITGTVYNDANANCVKDPGEAGIPNIMIHCSGRGYTFTNAAGVYSFQVPTGTYTMSETVQAYYPLAACQSNSVSVAATAAVGCTNTVNFANTTATIHDMRIQTISYSGPPVPGNPYYQTVIVKNDGTITESSILAGYKHDGQLGTPSSVPTSLSLYSPNHYRNNSGFSTLAPAATQSFTIQYSVPTNIPLLTSLVFLDSATHTAPMSNWLTDYTPWNNVNTYYSAVAGSFDPNNKEVSPTGTGSQGYISTDDSVLTYTIHFQNTGNYPAQKVVLVDTLDSDLDVLSLKPVASNHIFNTMITDGGSIVTFTFNNINLPDSNTDKLGSMGYVVYTVRQKPGLAVGAQIKNSADIYFDYNAPVKTNTTLNTIERSSLNIPATGAGKMTAGIYPNPAGDKVNIMIQSDGTKGSAQIRIVSLVGQVMQQQQVTMHSGRNVYEANTSGLTPGMYFVQVSDGARVSTIKLSIVR